MRRSPRRPLILKRRKLPFWPNEPAADESCSQTAASASTETSKPAAGQGLSDGIRIIDHPSMSDTQVVVIPSSADLQSVIGALTAKGKECGVQGPNKFILLSESSSQGGEEGKSVSVRNTFVKQVKAIPNSPDATPLTGVKQLIKDANCGPLDDSLTNIQWLGRMSTCGLESDLSKQTADKENPIPASQHLQAHKMQNDAESVQPPMSERPPYSYMAMIQFAINSKQNRKMTLKEIYTWIEEHFPYYRKVAKPGWKNSIRHNLSLHDMFIREATPDGKISLWTIRPEANRCLTLDQVYKQQKMMIPDARKTSSSERKMKPLLPRTDSYLVPIQLPVASLPYLPSSSASFTPIASQQKQSSSRGVKRVRIAPKVTQSNVPAEAASTQTDNSLKVEVKEELVCVPIQCETPKAPPRKEASSSRRKQRLVRSMTEEPVLLCPDNTFFDSGVASDASTFQETRDAELEEKPHGQESPDREFSFKTPVKGSSHLTSSTPSKPSSNVAPEPWKVTPVGKGNANVLDFSPIRTPGGPAVTPRHDYTTYSFNCTPFKDLPLFGSPWRELLLYAPSKASGPAESPSENLQSSCSRELLQAGNTTPTNRSITEGLILDTMNDSLSKVLVDISFSCLDDDDFGMANISWSEFLGQLK
ncbi:forkhead box protein M1 isoform X2 [Cololabis saira]|uniref:forkhead box protein M1 isoform X2 n=1 Tax=Cololabis saira TaxID=129043 RepID=UPI002AD528E1|nr:forkhead box protein M1 isoform X2 [Cololabis saira]